MAAKTCCMLSCCSCLSCPHSATSTCLMFAIHCHKVFCRAEVPCVSAVRAARAVIEEVPAAASSSISLMAACSESQSERDTHRMTRNVGLTLPLKFAQAEIGAALVPVILLSEWLRFLMANNLWFSLSGLSEPDEARSASQWQSFWDNYRKVHPGHPIFERAARGLVDLSTCAALLLHGDEGRTKKKTWHSHHISALDSGIRQSCFQTPWSGGLQQAKAELCGSHVGFTMDIRCTSQDLL